MGFSVSGATAVILIGGLIAFSFAFSAMTNGYERMADAREERSDRLLEQANAEIEIANATYDGNASALTVDVNNTGATDFTVGDVSLLVDGTYRSNVSTSVDGDDVTDVWLAGEQLTMTVDADTEPSRIKVVTETGTSAVTTEVNASG